MAKNEATLVLRIKEAGKEKINQLKGMMSKLGDTTKKVVGGLIAGYAAATAAIIKFGTQGVKFQQVEQSFRALATSQGQDAKKMLTNMRELSAGTISNMELMKQANQAMLLGLPVERFGEMVSIARGAAAATGESMQYMLNSIVTGVGRGSKLMLDNLGIIISTERAYVKHASAIGKSSAQLSDLEKKQAFANEAIRIGKENLENQGGTTDTAVDKWKSFGVTIINTKDNISKLFIPAFKELVRSTEPMIEKFSELSNHPFITTFAKGATKVFAGVNVALETTTAIISAKLIPLFNAIPEFIKGNFLKAKEAITAETKSVSDIVTQQKQVLNDRLAKIDADFLELQREKSEAEIEIEKAKLEAIALAKEERSIVDTELGAIRKEEELEREKIHAELKKDVALQEQLKRINAEIIAEKNNQKQLDLIRQKQAIKEKAFNEEKKRQASELAQFERFLNSQKVQNFQSTMGTISSLASSENKGLAAIGKAAAIADIGISTAQGVMRAMALGPIVGPILAPIVVAAGAVNAAKVAGIQLADGGIVRSTPGGVRATIGEAGQDEAVIPLGSGEAQDRLGALGGMTINFNGPLLGDQTEARQFAKAIDRELLALRRNNESVAFDQDFT